MFSWITGSRVTNAIEELEADVAYENTIIDAPETPAPHFAVKAFKHAVFGTPAPEDTAAAKKLQKKQPAGVAQIQAPELNAPKDGSAPCSPSKLPPGIMKTPVTASKSRKSVSFGAHVVDNEGKKGHMSKSGIPDDCPGKFPSPWTPGTELKTGLDSDVKPRTKLTAALLDARTAKQPNPGRKQKARDDSDITIDFGTPRSASGKYWKEEYENYAKQSEKEMKKLVQKQQMAKSFAKKKDDEVIELVKQLEQERKRHRRREHELEQQNKETQETLRLKMEEQRSAGMEIAALKTKIATFEKSSNVRSENQEDKPDIPVYEDASKEPVGSQSEIDPHQEFSYLSTKSHTRSTGKENAPPKPRHARHQTLPDARSARPHTVNSRLGVGDGEVSTVIGKSPRPQRASQSLTKSTHAASIVGQSHQIQSKVQADDPTKECAKPEGPSLAFQSSPLPQPSPGPDLWLMNNDESDYGAHDRMAIPISSGRSYAKPSRSRRHPIQPSLPSAKTERPKPTSQPGNMGRASAQPEAPLIDPNGHSPRISFHPGKTSKPSTTPEGAAKPTSQDVESTSREIKAKVESLQDRRELARQRVAERKRKKQNSTLV